MPEGARMKARFVITAMLLLAACGQSGGTSESTQDQSGAAGQYQQATPDQVMMGRVGHHSSPQQSDER
jgi:outer membrane biogenesis lipoprotein LolB